MLLLLGFQVSLNWKISVNSYLHIQAITHNRRRTLFMETLLFSQNTILIFDSWPHDFIKYSQNSTSPFDTINRFLLQWFILCILFWTSLLQQNEWNSKPFIQAYKALCILVPIYLLREKSKQWSNEVWIKITESPSSYHFLLCFPSHS